MGSWGLPAAGRSVRQVVVDYLTGAQFDTDPAGRHVIVSGPSRHDGAWWAIMRHPDTRPYLACVLASRHGGQVVVKGMDVTVGPAYHAPAGMFAEYVRLRPEPENGWEADWRARQRDHREPPSVAAGDLVHFARPLRFTDGTSADRLRFVGRFTFRRDDGTPVRLPRHWRRDLAYRVSRAPAEVA